MRVPIQRVVHACGALLCSVLSFAGASSGQGIEYEVKAAYVFNFVNASAWPPAAFSSPTAPFQVCLAESNPFAGLLNQTFQNEQVNGHPVVVSLVKTPNEVAACHLLFIPDGADASGALQKAAASAPVLTIGESRAFRKRGGIITFVLDSDRIRFDVNRQEAARTGVALSSKVLRVARQVS